LRCVREVGSPVGVEVGRPVGRSVGIMDGLRVGMVVGQRVGRPVGARVGSPLCQQVPGRQRACVALAGTGSCHRATCQRDLCRSRQGGFVSSCHLD
jgi:tetrahydromethanopterin S-methyltransferase subunit G